jgi:hypothetical protein
MTGSVHDVDELGDSLKLAFSLVPPPSAIIFEDCIPAGPAGAQRDQEHAASVRRAGSGGNLPSQMPASDFTPQSPPVVNHHTSASPVRAPSSATHLSATSQVLDFTFELSPMPPIDFSLPFGSPRPEAPMWGVERSDATAAATDAPRVSSEIQAAADTAPERSHTLPFEMPHQDMFPPLSVASPGPGEHGAAAVTHAKQTQALPFEVPPMDVSSPPSVESRDPKVPTTHLSASSKAPSPHSFASSKALELPFELSPMPPIDFSLPSDSPRPAAPTWGVESADATKSVAEAPRVSTELQAAADPPPARLPVQPFEMPPLDIFPPLSVASPGPAEHGARSKDAAVEDAKQTQALPKAGVISELQPLLQPRLLLAGLTSDEATPLLAKMDKDLLQRALTTGDVKPVITKLKAAAYQRPEMNKLGASSRNVLQNFLLAPENQMPPRPSTPPEGGEGVGLSAEYANGTQRASEETRVSTEIKNAASTAPARSRASSPTRPFKMPPLDTFHPLSAASPAAAEHGECSQDAAEHANKTHALEEATGMGQGARAHAGGARAKSRDTNSPSKTREREIKRERERERERASADRAASKASTIADLQRLLQPHLGVAGLALDEFAPLLGKLDKDFLQKALDTGNVQPVLTKLKAAAYQRPEMSKLQSSSGAESQANTTKRLNSPVYSDLVQRVYQDSDVSEFL